MKKFNIRCSAISNITAGEMGLTDKQESDIDFLGAKSKITLLQEEKLYKLIYKRDNPELPEGAKTYCKDWLKGQLLDFQTDFSSRYTDKGNIVEDESIDFIADILGYGFLIKNEDHFSDDFMMGTPDVIYGDTIIDVKNSWDSNTFPMFESEIPNTNYYWQLQGYMALTGKSKAKLIYTLMDTPEHLIVKEARYDSIRQGHEELDMDVYKKHHKNMTYTGIDDKLKIKVFDIERNDADIQKIKYRVIECRKYIDGLLKTIK